MQEGDMHEQPDQGQGDQGGSPPDGGPPGSSGGAFGGAAPDPSPDSPSPDSPSDSPSTDSPPPPPDSVPAETGRNLKLIVGSVVGLVLLAAAAVAAYAVLGLGGNTSPEAPEFPPPPVSGPSPSPSASLSPNQQVAVLKPLGQAAGDVSGEAARSATAGRFVIAVSADLPDLADGSFYEAFLIHPDSQTQFSAGKLYQVGDRWVMTLDQARDASDYREVIVTLETKDDGTPEKTILTGQF